MESEYLVHYGVKGMRWGVRRYQNPDGTLTRKGQKRMALREDKIKGLNSDLSYSQKRIKRDQSQLDDLNKNGFNSKTWKKAYGNDSDLNDDYYKDLGFNSKKDALDSLKGEIQRSIDYDNKSISDTKKAINSIKSASINKKTYAEKSKDGERVAKALFTGGALASIGIAVAAKKYGHLKTGTAALIGLSGLAISATSAGNAETSIKSKAWKDAIK